MISEHTMPMQTNNFGKFLFSVTFISKEHHPKHLLAKKSAIFSVLVSMGLSCYGDCLFSSASDIFAS